MSNNDDTDYLKEYISMPFEIKQYSGWQTSKGKKFFYKPYYCSLCKHKHKYGKIYEKHWRHKIDKMKKKKEKKQSYTYFLKATNSNLIKIGTSQKPHSRVKQIQSMSPEELRILVVVKGNREIEFHQKFKAFRSHGEWFEPSVDLLIEIIDLIISNKE